MHIRYGKKWVINNSHYFHYKIKSVEVFILCRIYRNENTFCLKISRTKVFLLQMINCQELVCALMLEHFLNILLVTHNYSPFFGTKIPPSPEGWKFQINPRNCITNVIFWAENSWIGNLNDKNLQTICFPKKSIFPLP